MNDLRLALRQMLRRPGFSTVVVLTLALGIGGSTAVFTLFHAVLLRPLPFAEPDRLVAVWERRGGSRDADLPVSGHEFVAWKERSTVFSHLAVIRGAAPTLTGRGEPAVIEALRVSGDFFPMLGVAPALGRTFADTGIGPPAAPFAVLGDRFWHQRLAADRRVIGQTIVLDGSSFTVIGVMPSLPASVEPAVWLPLDVRAEALAVGRHNLQVIGRLRDGVTPDRAQADLDVIARQLEDELPRENADHRVSLTGLREQLAGAVRLPLSVLLTAVGFVLLIACVNVANLLLARTTRRQQELAIRAALGAGRRRLIGHLLAECLLLALVGGGVGLLLAVWLVDLVPAFTTVHFPFADLARFDAPVLAVALGLSLVTGLATGLVPALRLSQAPFVRGLNEKSRITDDRQGRRIRSALVAAEVALALMLLVGAGLMINSFIRLTRVDPGFETRNVLVTQVDMPALRYDTPESRRAFADELHARLSALPGVVAAGATSNLPLGGSDNWMAFSIEGRPAPAPGQELNAAVRVVTPDYFHALGVPLRQGRLFTAADARRAVPVIRWYPQQPFPPGYDASQPAPVAIISEAAATRYWPGEDPIGKRIRVLFSPELTIVGVAGDVTHNALNGPRHPHIYLPHSQEPWASLSVVVRTSVPPLEVAAAVRAQIRALDANLPVTIRTMDDVFAGSVGQQRFYALLTGVFGLVALALAVVGVFAVVSYTTARRTTEIGVRMALGAPAGDVLRLIVRQNMAPILAGVVLGTLGALSLSRFLAHLLFETAPIDPPTYAGVGLLMTAIALTACWVPARRATRVSPVEALRHD